SALFSQFALAMSASGAVLAALMLSPARRLMPAPPAGETGEGLRQPMPFGVPIAVAGLCVLALRINQSL
uniref:hypothetical protein n=1 Tax=Phenylobacterium sp. TaxID=1871053 RepID=UPI0037852744